MSRTEVVPPSIPGYEISELLGTGSSADVWRAFEPQMNREVALKVFKAAGLTAQELEAQRHGSLWASRRVVRAWTIGTVPDGRVFLSLEYMPGGSLFNRLNCVGVLDWRRAAAVGANVADALDAAHSLHPQIVHRDVNPNNVLFDSDGEARLADFGIARLVTGGSAGQTRTVVGTPGYCAPEVFDGSVDPRSDIWGLGATLCAAIDGRAPGDRPADPAAMVAQPHHDLHPPLAGCPRPFRDLVLECLRADPAARPAAREVRDRLLALASPDPGSTGEQVYQRCMPSVVTISFQHLGGVVSGSGVLLTDDGIVATNAHVVKGAPGRDVSAQVFGHEMVGATILKRVAAPATQPSIASVDLAFVRIDPAAAGTGRPIPLGSLADVRAGMTVWALGSPRGLSGTFLQGVVSQLRKDPPVTWVQHQTPINPGNSGGPLVNADCKVVGLNTFITVDSQGLSFALDPDTVARELAELQQDLAAHPDAAYCLACGGVGRIDGRCVLCAGDPDQPPASTPEAPTDSTPRGVLPGPARNLDPARSTLTDEELARLLTQPEGTTSRFALPRTDVSSPAIVVPLALAQDLLKTANDIDLTLMRADIQCGFVESGHLDPLSGDALRLAAETVGQVAFLLRTTRISPRHEVPAAPTLLIQVASRLGGAGVSAYRLWTRCGADRRSGTTTYDWWCRVLARELGHLAVHPAVDPDQVQAVRAALWADNQVRDLYDRSRDPEVRKRESLYGALFAAIGYVSEMNRSLVSIADDKALAAGHDQLRERLRGLAGQAHEVRSELGIR